MSIKVLQISVDDLRQMVDAMVEEKLAIIFKDGEEDLEFTDKLQEILIRQSKEIENGERGELLEDVVARLGLEYVPNPFAERSQPQS